MLNQLPNNPKQGSRLNNLYPTCFNFRRLYIGCMKRPVGRPRLAIPKVQVTIRIEQDVLAHFRSSGQGWQTRVNDILRRKMQKDKK